MKLSIIIPAHNEEKFLPLTLESIKVNIPPGAAEIIVVDNASTDRTAAIAEKFAGVRVVAEKNKGLTHARQKGLMSAKGDFLAYIDADTRISRDWYGTLTDHFAKNPESVCLSGPYKYYDLPPIKNFIADALWWMFAPLTYRIVGYMVLGGNFVAKKSALMDMGGFDTSIAFYGEDTNIAWRLNKLGRVVFRMNFNVSTSGRRFEEEGIFKTNIVYALNFIWGVAFRKPFTQTYRDVRGLNSVDRRARRTAMSVTLLFFLFGVIGFMVAQRLDTASLLLGLFYILLLIHTYASVSFFTTLIPKENKTQKIVDLALLVLYAALAGHFHSPYYFFLYGALLFCASTIKYALLARILPHKSLLKRKIIINMLGATSSLAAVLLVRAGFASAATIGWTLLFLLANVYVLWLRPLYRLPAHETQQ